MRQRVSGHKRAAAGWLESQAVAALVALGCCLATPVARAATFTASLDRDTITVGESATLSLAFADGTPQDVPSPPEIPNLQIAYVGPSSQFSFINGQVSSSVTHNFTVIPRQPGDYTIPALTAQVGRERLSTKALTLKVLKATAPPPEAIASGSQIAFLRLALPRKEVYVGETFTAQLQIYLSSQVQRISQPQINPFPAGGFNIGKMVGAQRRRVQIGNGVYTVIPFDVALKAVKAGPLSLGPATVNLVLNPRDLFGDPFGMFGGGAQSKEITLAAEVEKVQSLPLPRENAPANFNGAVGSFSMTVAAGPTNVTAGDPITVKIQISGRGSLDSLTLPEQAAWQGFKVYSPSSKTEFTDQLDLQGTKTFEEIVAPQSAEIKELPPVSFSFFDPDQKAYRMLTQPPIPLAVRPGGPMAAPTIAVNRSSQEDAPPAQDIVAIKQRLGALAEVRPPLAQQPLFLALQGVPVLALVSSFVWRRRTENLANNPRLRRRRQVLHLIREGLEELRGLANEKRSDEFFAALFRLVQEQLGERLDLPASAITEAVIDERLRPRGVPDSTLSALHELFQTCNLARYAPMKTTQELAALIPKLEALLRELRDIKA